MIDAITTIKTQIAHALEAGDTPKAQTLKSELVRLEMELEWASREHELSYPGM